MNHDRRLVVQARVNQREYVEIERLIGGPPTSEALRGYLLHQAHRGPVDEALLAEVSSLRTVVLNALGTVAPHLIPALQAEIDRRVA